MADVIDNDIKRVIETDIFDYLGLHDLPEERQISVIEDLMISVRGRVMLRIADLLEASGAGEFERFKAMLNDENTTDESIIRYLKDHDIQVDAIAAGEAIQLKAEIMKINDDINGSQK